MEVDASLISEDCVGMTNRQMEVHYINTGFPYTVTESFMDLFEGLAYGQGSPNWSLMHAHSYKYGVNSTGRNSYSLSHAYEVNGPALRSDRGCVWENSWPLDDDVPPIALHRNDVAAGSGLRTHHNAANPQVIWQGNIDPDNMTYEELLDLGEAVGTQSRGLPEELILSLPVSKYKCSFFSRKKNRGERCVICQMDYKRGERQVTLPCKHVYHAGCISKWLGINKTCPICFAEVLVEKPRHA